MCALLVFCFLSSKESNNFFALLKSFIFSLHSSTAFFFASIIFSWASKSCWLGFLISPSEFITSSADSPFFTTLSRSSTSLFVMLYEFVHTFKLDSYSFNLSSGIELSSPNDDTSFPANRVCFSPHFVHTKGFPAWWLAVALINDWLASSIDFFANSRVFFFDSKSLFDVGNASALSLNSV